MYIPLWQGLSPRELVLSIQKRRFGDFPFNRPRFHTFYYARIGIYHLARRLCQLGYRKALFPAYHHGTEVNALEAGGLDLVFYNVHSDGKLDSEDLESRISSGDGVLFITHYNGFPQDMEKVLKLKQKHDLVLVEDVALSLYSKWEDRYLGDFGEASIFCPYKTFAIPNGGLLLINDERFDFDVKLRSPNRLSTAVHLVRMLLNWLDLRANGLGQVGLKVRPFLKRLMEGSKSEPVPIGDSSFNRDILDWRMASISDRILGQYDVEVVTSRRRFNYRYLLDRIRTLDDVRPLFPELGEGIVPLFFPVFVEDRELIHQKLQENGVETSCFWRPWLPNVPAQEFPEVDLLRKQILELPCHQDLSKKHLDFIVRCLKRVLKESRS